MARLLSYEGPELTLTMGQTTYITKAIDQGWSEDFYGGTVYLSVQAKRNGKIESGALFKIPSDGSDEVQIGQDIDLNALVGIHLGVPQMFTNAMNDMIGRTLTSEEIDHARAVHIKAGIVPAEEQVDEDDDQSFTPNPTGTTLRQKMEAARVLELEIEKTEKKARLLSSREKKKGAMSDELTEKLDEHGLMAFKPMLIKCMIADGRALKMHTLAEIIELFARKGVGGRDFVMSKVFKAAWSESGLLKRAEGTPKGASPAGKESHEDSDESDSTSGDSPAVAEKTKTTDLPSARPSWGEALGVKTKDLARCPHASALLLGAVQGPGMSINDVLVVDKVLYTSIGAPHDPPTSILSAIDSIEVTLEDGIQSGKWSLSELVPADMSARGVEKLARKLALRSIKVSANAKGKSGEAESKLAAAILDAQSNVLPHSASDFKIMEELDAARKRLGAVADDPIALKALTEFVNVLQSSEVNEGAKLIAYENLAVNHVEVSALLKSQHVREPKGTLSSNLRTAVDGYRSALNGIKSAAKAVLRDKLPHNAEPKLLIEAVFAGRLGASSDFSVHAIVEPGKPRSWLGTPLPGEGKKKDGDDIGYLITLFTALPQIGYALEVLMPNDKTVTDTWASICAEIARGLRRGGVVGAVDNVLAPLLKAYEEKWEAFQKLSSATMPTLKEVWAIERTSTTMSAYLNATALLVSNPTIGAAGSQPSSDMDKVFEKRFKQLEDRLKSMSDAEDDHESKDKAAKKKLKKQRQKEAKAKKDAEAKAASGAE